MSIMSRNKSGKLRYIAYVRKSDPRKERQLLSHTTQTRRIKEQFPDLDIVKWMEAESQSAFVPGRPIFNRMLGMIKNGEADGIVCYNTNRLSRNEIDAAEITYMVRQKKILDLKFCNYAFEPTSEGIMMLQFLLSQSQYESSKQGKFVSDGMTEKAIGGERPGQVALGYMKVPVLDENNQPIIKQKDQKVLTRTAKDPERYDLVNKIWRMFLSGTYTVPQIQKQITAEGLTTRFVFKKDKNTEIKIKSGGGPITKTGVYRILTNRYYAGWIYHKGEYHEGNHKRIKMINLEDFDYAQTLLGKKGKPRLGVNDYAFTSLIHCGECGCSIAGKIVWKWIKSEKKMKAFVYYHCTRTSSKRPCTQVKYTTLDQLEKDIDTELSKYTILPEFRDLALQILHRNHKVEVKERTQIYKNQQNKREQVQEQLDELVGMRTRQLLDDDEYLEQKNKLMLDMDKLDDSLRDTEQRADNWLKLTEKAFDFATYARIRFRNTKDLKVKRDILLTLGQNLLLKDQKLTLERSEWLVPIAEQYPELEAKYLRNIRTVNKVSSKERIKALEPILETWRAQWDLNPRHAA